MRMDETLSPDEILVQEVGVEEGGGGGVESGSRATREPECLM